MGFSKDFRFNDAFRLVSYLDALGVSSLYASPLFRARTGSSHGYDITDPASLNPEIGTTADFSRLSGALSAKGMGLVLDIVPNHMAAHFENRWWRDVLEYGELSPFAIFFDIDWDPPQEALNKRISLPVLGAPYARVLESGELRLDYDQQGFAIYYWDNRLPVSPFSILPIVSDIDERYRHFIKEKPEDHVGRMESSRILEAVEDLSGKSREPGKNRMRIRKSRSVLGKLWSLFRKDPDFKRAVSETVASYRGVRSVPSSWDRLDRIINDQVYWLSHWKTVTRTLNYRRFFDVADLVGIRTEDPGVFSALHGLVISLWKKGWISGVRVDHVDGLSDPEGYLKTLSEELSLASGSSLSPDIWVEKILLEDEQVDSHWPVNGTTGYDFLNRMNRLFVDHEGANRLAMWYSERIDPGASFKDICYQQKKKICETLLGGELRRLTFILEYLAQKSRYARELSFREIQTGLVEVTACMSVYRTYVRDGHISEQDRLVFKKTLQEARRRHPGRRRGLYQFFEQVFLMDFPEGISSDHRKLWIDFVNRWQQFTGPVMAKGVEDTSFYLYSPLISANEVGGDPEHLSTSSDRFHTLNRNRLEHEPRALSATSTHDTKRSEDVRARINVLSEISSEWISRAEKWMKLNRKARIRGQSDWIPEPGLELFIYQTLLGAWPLSRNEEESFRTRMASYLLKVARERKRHSDWITPDVVYEESLLAFLSGILREERSNHFLADFRIFQRRIAIGGAINSLAQTIVKILSPGVPDFYQGTELWDFSLVDPDNRRPVDYTLRERLLDGIRGRIREAPAALFEELLSGWEDGRIKLYVTHVLLQLRRAFPDLFCSGGYYPLPEEWEESEHMFGFARMLGDQVVLLAVSRKPLSYVDGQSRLTVDPGVWGDRRMPLPAGIPGSLTNAFSGCPVPVSPEGDSGMAGESSVRMSDAFGGSLFTVLVSSGQFIGKAGEDGVSTGIGYLQKERGGGGGVG
jgi:(1->4)-alpha-D-glucan 1-alpha-D-glucosylmutase